MLKYHLESTSRADALRLEAWKRNQGFQSLRRALGFDSDFVVPEGVVVCEVSAEKCFVAQGFNDELPLYIFDEREYILILFGQWLYDPHVLTVSDQIFDRWDNEHEFFSTFTLRFSKDMGVALELEIYGQSFTKTEYLPFEPKFRKLLECQLIHKTEGSLIIDLRNAGVVE